MLLDHAGSILARLCFSGPALYIALLMIMDTTNFVRLFHHFVYEIRNLEQGWRSGHFEKGLPDQDQPALSRQAKIGFRLGGLALALTAFLHLAGLVS